MPRANEIAFNAELANVLRRKNPQWRQNIGAEQHAVFEQAPLRPEILVNHPGGLPVAVETEFEPARTVEQDALTRLGQLTGPAGDRIEQSLAVRVPLALRSDLGGLARQIESAAFAYCVLLASNEGKSDVVAR